MQPIFLLNLTRPFADISVGVILLGFFIYGVIAFSAIVLIEAILLRLVQWGSFGRSLLDSFLINLASSAAGIVLAIGGFPLAFLFTENMIPTLLLGLALSILIEGGMLWLLREETLRKTALTAVTINAATYTGLALLASRMGW